MSALVTTVIFLFVAQTSPRISVSPLHAALGDNVEVHGTGFTPNRYVSSHLRRPDGTEYPPLRILTNERGEYFKTIETLLFTTGTYELWVEDEATKAVAKMVRFAVGFEPTTPPPPDIQDLVLPYLGVWSGTRSDGATVLIAITDARNGEVAGTVAYPSLSCGGILTYRSVSTDSIELVEKIAFGPERCMNGKVKLGRPGGGEMKFEWNHTTLAKPLTAILRRQN